MGNLSTYDIIEMIYKHNKFNAKHTIEDVRDLLLQLDNGSVFFRMSLESELEMFAETKGVCPQCGESIVTISESDEDRGEYFGTAVTEKEITLGCPECGYTRD